jgi:hypothetical protein
MGQGRAGAGLALSMSMGCSWVPRCVATAKNLREVLRLVEVVTVKVTCGRAGQR